MRNHENEGSSNDDWEDHWATNWNEFNWEKYLQNEESEVEKYQTIYSKLIRSASRLDEVALYMGWQRKQDADEECESSECAAEEVPYTIHRHPLYVSSKALHGWLLAQWKRRIAISPNSVSAHSALEYQSVLVESDHYGVLAVTALDLDDFALAIAYFKRGMVAINTALARLSEIDSLGNDSLSLYAKHARIRLFDIREIWLRVASDCRATISRGSDED